MKGKLTRWGLAPFSNAEKLNSFSVLEQDPNGKLLWNEKEKLAMIYHEDSKQAVQWLKKYQEACTGFPILMAMGQPACAAARMIFPFKEEEDCIQAVWTKQRTPALEMPYGVSIRNARTDDLDWIVSNYDLADEQELKECIQHQNLFVLDDQGRNAGFAGFHSEGSMGMLFVFPEFRRKNFGFILEQFMIVKAIEKNIIPYCHVFSWNQASLHLQQKVGMTLLETPVIWFIDAEAE